MDSPTRTRVRLSNGLHLSVVTAGSPVNPAVLLLHGFPNSARGFRDLIPALAEVCYVVAPDLPGFGESDVLANATFDRMGVAIEELLVLLGVERRFIYVHDFGAPIAFDIAMRAPGKVLGLIVQNANAHESGFDDAWNATRAFWENPTADNERRATSHLTLEGLRDQYVANVPDDITVRISPETWELDWLTMNLPGHLAMQRRLVLDYGNYVARFGAIERYLRDHQPAAVLLWGRHDNFFNLAEVQSWMQDLPRMDVHVLDAGHLLLETRAADVARIMLDFIKKVMHQAMLSER